MRILLAHHGPLDESCDARAMLGLLDALETVGHSARLIVADGRAADNDPHGVRRVVACGDPAAGLPAELPSLGSKSASDDGDERRITFVQLTPREWAAYREALRRGLDAEVERFDPHLIHVAHVWVLGQLALETGVPYVLTAWGPELPARVSDRQCRLLADQAAENAARILVANEPLAAIVRATFSLLDDRVTVVPPGDAARIAAVYEEVDSRQ